MQDHSETEVNPLLQCAMEFLSENYVTRKVVLFDKL